MSKEFDATRPDIDKIELCDFLRAVEAGGLRAPLQSGRRSRRRAMKSQLAQASLLAPLLAADAVSSAARAASDRSERDDGILRRDMLEPELKEWQSSPRSDNIRPEVDGVSMPQRSVIIEGENAGVSQKTVAARVNAKKDDGFVATSGEALHIPVESVLQNDTNGSIDSLHVVRVFKARNGTVELDGDTIIFTPRAGFEGRASFRYKLETDDGRSSKAKVKIDVIAPIPERTLNEVRDQSPVVGEEPLHDGEDHRHTDNEQSHDSHTSDDGARSSTPEQDTVMDHEPGMDHHGDMQIDPGFGGGEPNIGGHHQGGGHDQDSDQSDNTDHHEEHSDDGDHQGAVEEDHGMHGNGDDGGSNEHGSHDGDSGGGHDEMQGGGAHDDMHGDMDGGHVHPDDPSKHAEHMAALNLVPVSAASHVAVNSGSWFDPNTWANGSVPGGGAAVVIPHGVSVHYDGESPVSLYTVRVDGALKFATDADTFMEVDTMVVSPSGHLTIGTVGDPVQAGIKSVIQIADNGPIDVAWDPLLLSRGVISHGKTEIHGQQKDPFFQVSVDPMAGDTSLTLEAAPAGWEVGDTIVLTGTTLDSSPWMPNENIQDVTTEDEELTIVAINGNTIVFDRPLQFDHDGPRPDLKAYVANYSRNVVIQTENADSIPVHQRGHTMFMHSDDVDVRYAEFFELGRTDKSERSLEVHDLSSTQSDTNIKARYPLHLHRSGVSELDDPAMIVGNSVWGSPGWGFVHHDSNAIFTDNAAYDIFGASFVAETGNETGRWSHNISIKNTGVSNSPKDGSDLDAFDLGRSGAGFWFQGRLVDAVDNVAASSPGGHGFVYNSRGWEGDVIKVGLDIAKQPEALRYQDESFINNPNIGVFDGNVSLGNEIGLEVIKASPQQGHDIRTIISDFTAWEARVGVFLHYTAHYTLEDLDLVAARTPVAKWVNGAGISYGANTVDIVVNDANIEGFTSGVRMSRAIVNLPADQSQIEREYTFIDVNITGNTGPEYWNTNASDRILSSDELSQQGFSFVSDVPDFTMGPNHGTSPLILSGIKHDGLGQTTVSSNWDQHSYDWKSLRGAVEVEGYWTLPDGRNVTFLDQYVTDRVTGEVHKTGVFIEIPAGRDLTPGGNFVRTDPPYNGVLDLSNVAPNAGDDFASVKQNSSVILDVLANDSDPDGDPLAVDGLRHPKYGLLIDNQDGTLTYTPDPNYVGADEFWYWVEDDAGNFSKAHVQLTVEI